MTDEQWDAYIAERMRPLFEALDRVYAAALGGNELARTAFDEDGIERPVKAPKRQPERFDYKLAQAGDE